MNKKYFLMVLLALVAWVGRAQMAPDTVTINFQLASKAKGETAGVLYPDFLTFEAPSLQPVTDSNGRWTVRIPAYRTLHVKVWDQNKIQRVVGREIHLFCRPGTETNILLDDINNHCIFTGENAEAHQAQVDHPLEIVYFNGKVDDMEIGAAAQSIRAIHELNLQRIDSLCNALPTLPDGYVEALRAIANYGFGKNMTENVIGHFQQNMGRFIEQGNKLPKEYVDLLHETETHELTHPNRWITRDAIFYFSNMMSLEALAQNGIVQEILDDEGDDFQLSQLKQYCSLIDALDASDEVKQMLSKGCKKIKVHGTGGGCLLIKTNVLYKLPKPLFKWIDYDDGHGTLSEDLFFCTQCKNAGVDIHADLRVNCGHVVRETRWVM